MLTVGEILRRVRLEKNLTFEEVEKQLKIRKKFLVALEENDWNKLPSLPYIKGFLKNYSQFLGLKPEEMLAIFRRQFEYREKTGLLPDGLTNPIDEPIIHFTPKMTVATIIVSFFLFFLGYLFLQYLAYTSYPNLTITKPAEGEIIISEKVTVEGKTDADAVLAINNQKIAVTQNGEFSQTLKLPPGVNTIQIESTGKSGKKKTIQRTIQVGSSEKPIKN